MSGWIEHAFGAGKDFVEQPDPAHSFIMITLNACLKRFRFDFSIPLVAASRATFPSTSVSSVATSKVRWAFGVDSTTFSRMSKGSSVTRRFLAARKFSVSE
ncbi:MAG: hypothetical protein E5Y73_13590 [Mesorhizobium sp.]|uniref:hypothetical protein n=1 Tax=Mesorhizobium sp. TaxID=1871066 RepID=UPI00120E40D1|nr:hypothetical protein [Mesorhizobium sp.]TIL93443.1 MAG: hypothetical protein E5Y73_13590 [Mesorhizobium sp.]